MKFPKLTWAFWKILAATLTTKRLSHQMCAESPRSPLFQLLQLPPPSARSVVTMLPLAEHSGLSRHVDGCTSYSCFWAMTLSEASSLQFHDLCLLFGTGFPLGWQTPKDVILPLSLLLTFLNQMVLCLGSAPGTPASLRLTDSETYWVSSFSRESGSADTPPLSRASSAGLKGREWEAWLIHN